MNLFMRMFQRGRRKQRNGIVRRKKALLALELIRSVKQQLGKDFEDYNDDGHRQIPKGGNSSFIALTPKVPNANMVKDFRPISLIGSLYKIIAKILANHLVMVLGDLVNKIQSAFVADRQILDVPFIMNELVQWFVQGIVLAPSLHLSHMFYADDAIFMGQWSESNIDIIVHVLECFHRASGLRKLMGIFVNAVKVEHAAAKIGCVTLKTPFTYLGACVGGLMSQLQSWNEIVESAIPIYHMSIFKVPLKVLHRMESIRSQFFNSAEPHNKKPIWVKWKNALASKDKGGLGVSSLFAVIKALHGEDGKIGKKVKSTYPSLWLNIIHEVELLKLRGIDLISFIHSKLGNGVNTSFWDVAWRGEIAFKVLYPRIYALESIKGIDVASKLSHSGLEFSFRRNPRGGVEQVQFGLLKEKVEGCVLVNMKDRWVWSLEGSGDFSVASIRKLIDGVLLPEVSTKTRWIKAFPSRLMFTRGRLSLIAFLPDLISPVEIMRKISHWWDIGYMEITSYEEWLDWIVNLRLSLKACDPGLISHSYPRVPLILGRPFLRTARVLIDVHGEELVIRDGMERIVFKPDGSQDNESIHMMDVYDDRSPKIGKDCDFPLGDDFQSFKTFSNPLFEKQDDFPSRNDESILKEEVHTENLKSHLNPLFEKDEEIISNEVSRQISPKVDVKTIVSFFSPIGNCVRKWATSEFVKDNDEVNHEVFKSENENDLGVHDNEEEEIAFLDGLLEDENFFEINDKKVEFLERKTKEDFETKVEPEKKKELKGKVFDPGISHFEKDAFKDKSSKELASSKALLTLDVFDPPHPPLMDFHERIIKQKEAKTVKNRQETEKTSQEVKNEAKDQSRISPIQQERKTKLNIESQGPILTSFKDYKGSFVYLKVKG
ncbi:hypothetical protein Tco_0973854 [Tanacetum coccineum]|uniref:Reverse transcriptase domain-containing protein n=1 Tax=Tanacetum coccineum TaxID=301880 RepID=A0ABQ5EAV3_9ASTR